MKGGPFEDKKIFEKKSHSAEKKRKKIERGDSLVPSGFVGYLEKVKMKGRTLCTKFAMARKFFQKKSHSAEKCKREDPLGCINIQSVAKYEKNSKRDSFGTLKIFSKKSRTAPKKNKGGTL